MRAAIRRILDRLSPRRRARGEELRLRAEHRARWCLAKHPLYPWVECSWYVADRPGRTHPGDHSGDWFEWPQDRPLILGVTTACALGDCGTCPTPAACGCGCHTPPVPTPPHLRTSKEDTGV